MSTVFITFYKYTGQSDMYSICLFLQQIREDQCIFLKNEIQEILQESDITVNTKRLARTIVRLATINDDRSAYNAKSEVALFFDHRDVYMLFSGISESILRKKIELLDYSYDGRGDKPDEITEEGWHHRFETLQRVIPTTVEKSGFLHILTDYIDAVRIIDSL